MPSGKLKLSHMWTGRTFCSSLHKVWKGYCEKGKGKQVNSVEIETREGTPSSGEEESRVLNTIRAIKSVSPKWKFS